MKTLAFFIYPFRNGEEKDYHCLYSHNFFPVTLKSGANYKEAGEKMLSFLIEEGEKSTFDKSIVLTTKDKGKHIPAKKGELVSIKNSLEKFIQDNKLNIKLEIAA